MADSNPGSPEIDCRVGIFQQNTSNCFNRVHAGWLLDGEIGNVLRLGNDSAFIF